jgi:hypothetical protein
MARVIHDDLGATLGEEAIAYSTVTKHLREAQTGPDAATALTEEISPHSDDSNEAILRALEELPFSSVRQLSRAAHRPKTTVYRYSMRNSGLTRVISDEYRIFCRTIGSNARPMFKAPFDSIAGIKNQRLARYRDSE